MGDLLRQLVDFLREHLGVRATGVVALCLAGLYIWYQHLRGKLLKEQLELEKRRGREFLDTVQELKQSPSPEPTEASRGQTGHILVVDDEAAIRVVVPRVLHDAYPSLRIETASDGAEAFDKITQDQPAILITDIVMSSLTGIELLKRLQDRGIRIPTLVISAYSRPDGFAELLDREGVSPSESILFLPKPFGSGDLIDILLKLKRPTEEQGDFGDCIERA